MKSSFALILTAAFLLPGFAQAKGCIKGAVVGGVAGHVAGHHAVVGAAAGYVVGHHLARKSSRNSCNSNGSNARSHLPPGQRAHGSRRRVSRGMTVAAVRP